jgi:SAM-dependent methyltransferase
MDQKTAEKILDDIRRGYNAIAEEFSVSRDKLFWEELTRFVDYVREGEAVLDVGCGGGRAYELFKPKGVRYAGLDVAEALIAKARERWMGTDARFEVGDILNLPVESGRFDAVVAVAVLHHIPSEAYRLQAMRELARAVRRGGYVMLTTWNLWQMRYWHVLLHQLFGKRNGWDFGDLKISWKKPHFARYYHVFTMKELRRLCQAAELDVVEQHYVKKGEIVNWLRGENLVTIARKP